MKKIIFLCLGNPYTPNMRYKENYLIKAAVDNGHDVVVVATNRTYKNGVEVDVAEESSNIDGYKLIRIKNKNLGIKTLTDKIRVTPKLLEIIKNYQPDLLFYNCPQIYNVNELKEIKKCLPNSKIIWDFSTWYGNSGKNWISLNILHRLIYGNWLRKNQKYVDKIYYTADDPHIFIKEVYGLDERKMELHDLPGEVINVEEKKTYKQKLFNEFGLIDDDIAIVHTGKLDKNKKTIELLNAFKECEDTRLQLFIIGSISDEIKKEAETLINSDRRIRYLGFKSGSELIDYIRGCDIYIQPGSTSQTLNDAICSCCAIIYRNRNYDNTIVGEYGWRIDKDSDINRIIQELSKEQNLSDKLSDFSYKMEEAAKRRLDYRVLYNRMWE